MSGIKGKLMKYLIVIFTVLFLISSCDTSDTSRKTSSSEDVFLVDEMPKAVSDLIYASIPEQWRPHEVYRLTDMETSEVYYFLNMGPDRVWNRIVASDFAESLSGDDCYWFSTENIYINASKEVIDVKDSAFKKELYWNNPDELKIVELSLGTDLEFKPSEAAISNEEGLITSLRLFSAGSFVYGNFSLYSSDQNQYSAFVLGDEGLSGRNETYLFGYKIALEDVKLSEDATEAASGNNYAVMKVTVDDEERIPSTSGAVFRLKEGETLSGDGLALKCVSINDSRCPIELVCDGKSSLSSVIELSIEGSEAAVLELEQGTETDYAGYRINLVSAFPYPTWDSRGPADRFVLLTVECIQSR